MKHPRVLLAVAACFAAGTLSTPAYAAGSTITTTGLNLPQGVTLAEAPSFLYSADQGVTSACMKFSYTGEPTTLFFHDLAVNGSTTAGDYYIGRQEVTIPNDSQQYLGQCIAVGRGDLRATGATFALSSSLAQTVVAEKTNLEFPDAYQTLTTKLAALGFTTTGGYLSWWQDSDSGNTQYGMYVGITPTTDISSKPVTLKISNAVLRPASGNPLALSPTSRTQTISGVDEIYFGATFTDPGVGLGRGQLTPQLDADLSVVYPTTFTTSSTLPAGLKLASDPANWYYDERADKTFITGGMLTNSSSKSVNVSVGGAKLYSVSGQTQTNLNLPAAPTQFMTVPPKGEMYVSLFSAGVPGDFRYDKTLSLAATVKVVTPSSLDVKGLKVPSGYTVKSAGFDNFFYNSEDKETVLLLLLTQPTRGADKALVLAGATLNGKSVPTAVSNGYNWDESAVRTFYLELGTVTGDARVGKSFKLVGSLTAAAKTTFKSTAVLDKPNLGVAALEDGQLFPPQPWVINYEASKKKSTISVKMLNITEADARIGTCKLVLKVNGKTTAIPARNATVRANSNPIITLATVSGDLRYGASVTLSGTFKYGGC